MDLPQTLSTFLTTYPVGRDFVTYVARLSDDTWTVEFATGPALRVTLDTAGQRLGITADLGAAPEGRQANVHEALLSYSALWRSTGGVRGALGGDGVAMLIVEMPLAEVSESRLHRVLDNFGVKARFWAGFVAAGAQTQSAPDTSSFIRV